MIFINTSQGGRQMSEDKQISRRNFMAIATWAIGGFIAIALAIPGVAYIIGPALQRQEEGNWIRLGSTSKVELGAPTLFKVNIQRQTGWILNEDELSVYVLTDNGRDYVAMSNICTHLGCRVRWISDQEQFFCPCHNAVFSKDGSVGSGPPPRPLDRYEVKVEDDQLYVLGG
jgi:menaquinol-cytochrome c reductase iron-sulfur subunit